ncbi:MAG: phytanoyl-CoA dioxygenase family protein [Armatimonadetes bacterium]|nr:phytanoyl-CoA dioxygenase family protein [Armatimonadota bacterium]
MLTREQIASYQTNGYLVVENVISDEMVAQARAVIEGFIERSRAVTENDAVFDLEPGHSPDAPKLRRLKDPVKQHPIFEEIMRSERILDVVADLIGPNIRFQASKLNMKSAEFGSPVEWHQDIAFYPHTNDDLLAVGMALDDCTLENGCMLMIPGSHNGPVLNHHQDGIFVGAIDGERDQIDLSHAVPVLVKAGGMSVHHVRTLHGSAPNRSDKPRRLLLFQYTAVDAWPLSGVTDLGAFNAQIVRGNPTAEYRLAPTRVRIPLPQGERAGSIYEIQSVFKKPVFVRR